MITFLSLAVNGIMLGCLYGMIAMGLVLIFKATGAFNMAQGELVMVGGLFFWWSLVQVGLTPILAIILALVLSAVLALCIERLAIRPLIGESPFTVIMMTIAVAMILRGGSMIVWDPKVKFVPSIFPEEYIHFIGDISVAPYLFIGFLSSIFMLFIFWLFFSYTKIGLKMRCVSDNQVGAQSVGIAISRTMIAAWILSSLVATLGAVILVSGMGTISVDLSEIGMFGFAVALLAGLESLPGALIAGLIIGVGEILAKFYVDPLVDGGMGELFPYLIMIIILVVRPYGLFGLKKIERV